MLRVVELARRSERHASSFRDFVERLNQGAERGEMDEAPIVRFSVHTGHWLSCNKSGAEANRRRSSRNLWAGDSCTGSPVIKISQTATVTTCPLPPWPLGFL